MRSEMYMKLLQAVQDLMKDREHGDIAMGYISLELYGIPDEKSKIAFLQKVLKINGRSIDGKLRGSLKERIEKSIGDSETMGD